MRIDAANFATANQSPSKEPRYVIEVSFDSANTDLYYFTSHADAALPVAALSIDGVVKGISGTSQNVTPEKALATIGTLSFQVVDFGDSIRTLQYDKQQLGKSLRGKRTRVYIGYAGLVWADYSLVTTQIISDVSYDKEAYNFNCADVQREARKDVFELGKTNLSQSLLIGETTVNVYATVAFVALEHSNSFSDAPSQTVYYFKIEDEIIRATGKTATSFTGCTRGVLNTKEVDHTVDASASEERRTLVTEYVYLELPPPKLAYAILTGILIGQGGATLPPTWHLGISTDYVRESDFSSIGSDLFDTADDSLGLVLRFAGLEKQDGKKFIEKELLLLTGTFTPVYGDGALGLKRMTQVLSKSGYSYLLDESNVVSHTKLLHDMNSMYNNIQIKWNWLDSREEYSRTNTLIDSNSITVFGKAPQSKFSFRGLNGSRHSTETLSERFNSFRDRYTGPPLRISVTCLPSTNILEVGDTIRLSLPSINDYNADTPLDRTFEVQNVSVNWITGAVTFKLFGSSLESTEIASVTTDNVVPDAWYTSEGQNLATYIGGGYDATTDYENISGVGHIKATSTLNGNASLKNTAAIYYHDGDLVIDPDVILSFTDNIQLRVKGNLTINGSIDGAGAGLAGAPYRATDREFGVSPLGPFKWENKTLGTAGFIGTTQSGGGWYDPAPDRIAIFYSGQGWNTTGLNSVAPKLTFENINGSVEGIPDDIRGTSGSTGRVTTLQWSNGGWATMAGGAGGSGGGGLFVTARGVTFGASGNIDVSGGNGGDGDHFGSGPNESVFTTNPPDFYAGSGAGGAPGAVYFAIDGISSPIPVLDNVTACYGTTPVNGNAMVSPQQTVVSGGRLVSPTARPFYSYYTGVGCPAADLSGYDGASRIAFVIGAEVPEEDPAAFVLSPPTTLVLSSGTADLLLNEDGTITARIKVSWTAPTDARVTGYNVQYKKSADSVWINSVDVVGEVQSYISPIESGISYDVRIRSGDNVGETSNWVSQTSYLAIGKSAPPEDVQNFYVYTNGIATVFKWDQVTDTDLAGYEIRYVTQSAATNWGDGIRLTSITRGTNVTSVDVPDGDWTFMIKAADTSGNQSVTATTADLSIVSDYDVVSVTEESPAWSGIAEPRNLFTYSEQLDHANWIRFWAGGAGGGDIIITPNDVLDPDGALTADRIEFFDLGGSNRQLTQAVVVEDGLTYTVSVYFKWLSGGTAVDKHRLWMAANGSPYTTYAVMDLSPYFDGAWHRVSITGYKAVDGIDPKIGIISYDEDIEFSIWGAQVAPCDSAQPYIKTEATAVTDGGCPSLTGFGMLKLFDNTLMPNGQALMSTYTDWADFDQAVPDPYPNCYYEISSPIDMLFDTVIRAWSLIQSTLHPLDYIGVADPHADISYSLDGGSYNAFAQWSIGTINARYVKLRVHVITSVGIPIISGMQNTVDAIERSETGTATIGATGTVITFDTQFHLVPFVEVQVQSATFLVVTYELLSETSFKPHVFNSAGTEVGGTISWKATGV